MKLVDLKLRKLIRTELMKLKEKSPEGWEDTVKAIKDEPEIDEELLE